MSDHEPARSRPPDLRAWGRWIRLLRTARGLTQEELGHLAGTDKNTIGRIERGEKNVGVAYVWRLAPALGVRRTCSPMRRTPHPRRHGGWPGGSSAVIGGHRRRPRVRRAGAPAGRAVPG